MKYLKKQSTGNPSIAEKYQPKYSKMLQHQRSKPLDKSPQHQKLILKYQSTYTPKLKLDLKENQEPKDDYDRNAYAKELMSRSQSIMKKINPILQNRQNRQNQPASSRNYQTEKAVGQLSAARSLQSRSQRQAPQQSDRKQRQFRKQQILKRIQQLNKKNDNVRTRHPPTVLNSSIQHSKSRERLQTDRDETIKTLQKELKKKNQRIQELQLQLRRRDQDLGSLQRTGNELKRVIEQLVRRREQCLRG